MQAPMEESKEINQRSSYSSELENSPPSHMEEEEDAQKKRSCKDENNYGNLHSNEAESGIDVKFIELPIQEVLDEEYTPTITQHLNFEFKEVKATKERTEKGIVTMKQKKISMKKRRLAKNNPTSTLKSKVNQANNNKRKLVWRNLYQGELIFSSSPLESFFLTNWKKRKKIQEQP